MCAEKDSLSVSGLSGGESWNQLAMSVIRVGWGSGGTHGVMVYESSRAGDGEFEQIQNN